MVILIFDNIEHKKEQISSAINWYFRKSFPIEVNKIKKKISILGKCVVSACVH